MKKILVAGGAGYIGSAMVKKLLQEKYQPVVLDNLSAGHRRLVDPKALFIKGDLEDPRQIEKVFKQHKIDAVMHFAASALVGESVENPLKYYQNNVSCCVNLLQAMKKYGVKKFIFSSTCATYGEPQRVPISERHPQDPTNPYGRTKLVIEWMLKDLARQEEIQFIALRYFNACGAHSSGEIGEIHAPETHLIPNVLKVAAGKNKKLTIFGDRYKTPDGTCVRDYIHIEDIADAHLLALKALASGIRNDFFNLGLGKGFSNLQIVRMAEKVTGKKIPFTIGPGRPGDPSTLIADASRARKVLGWKPSRGLEQMIRSAWDWEKKQR